ncbi:amidohydrolase [Rhizobium oryzihabitans]|uniref:Amidohydrolase n=1 Tax=Rhizobium oryzihabitans TaxID=2267833 RepID=A0A7L5BPS5_9HYPH|nr:M20 aminoacylase family protein [Rhizobium oryzihabitans]MCW0983502.1 M20 family metallopeptidase [Agrobacterium sp. BT-220-3]QCM07898.1 amidohydrolase [Agrobacterium tumefaciens]CUX51839.1 Putative Amidohydrolase family protein; putative hippurate hydrolase (Benzoylglycine amidohydrolase) [Agrobacterium genomosp. 5 str. CFBP 6626]QCM13128.1 amidohydrolase [Agrobacterium tumefaciens]QIB40878.1 amidohydrolase [Rhizobium oryzihabitans]
MPILNRVAEMQEEVAGWRRHLHETPELLYDVFETSKFVAEKLKAFGCDIVETGIGKTGVVGIIKGRHGDGPTIGFRSDMDALPILETSGKPWASKVPGKAHSCGHDGHTAMLLGAAQYLAETRNFKGSVAVIFQPAEEGGAGALAMLNDGMMEKFGISQVYGMHNEPGIPVGNFAIRKGSTMAAADAFEITITGKGSHAAAPHLSIDPVLTSAYIIIALQSIVSRETDPLKSLVVTVATTHGGTAGNVIPGSVTLTGTVRTLLPETRDFAEKRLKEVATATAMAHGATAEVKYDRGYPVTFNHNDETEFATGVAVGVAGANAVNTNPNPHMGAEDFSYMLESRPGAFIFIGNGDTAGLHNAAYDFNDDALPYGISYWVSMAETALAA